MRSPAVALLVALLAPAGAGAQPVSDASGPDTYLEVHLGAFVPQHGDLDAFDPGLALGGTFGARFNANVAVEAAIGYTHASAGGGVTQTLSDVPVLASLRLVLPFKAAELNVRGGVGVHFAWYSSDAADLTTSDSSATAFGYHVGAGAAFKVWPTTLVGVDVLRTFVAAKFDGAERNLDGLRVAVTLGYRL